MNKKDNKLQAKSNFAKFSLSSFFRLVGKIRIKSRGENQVDNKIDGKNVMVVAGDLGGWHATVVVLEQLADRGANVSVVFSGPSRRAFLEKILDLDSRFIIHTGDTDAVGAIHELPLCECYDVVVVAPSQSKDGNDETLKIVNEFKDSVPVCVIEDMWGSAVHFLIKIKPQVFERVSVFVVDQFAKKMLIESTGIKARQVFVTGGPQFDRVLELKKDWDKQRKLIRENLSDDCLVYLVAGGVNGTGEILDLVKSILRPQDVIIFRQHSRSTEKDKKRTEDVIEKIMQAGGKFLEIDKKIAPYAESLLAGADFVLSGFSTTNRYAILLGIAGTIYVGTKSFRKDLWAEKKLKLPPEVEFGAGWYVRNIKEMKMVVEEVSASVAGKRRKEIIKKQQKIAQFCDGKATQRVIGVIGSLRSEC